MLLGRQGPQVEELRQHGVAFDERLQGGGLVVAVVVEHVGVAGMEVVVLVGEGVRQLVDQGGALEHRESVLRPRHHQLPGFAVVETGHLLRVKVGVEPGQVDVRLDKAQEAIEGLIGGEIRQVLLQLLPHPFRQFVCRNHRHLRLLAELQLPHRLGDGDQLGQLLADLLGQLLGAGGQRGGRRGGGGVGGGGGSGRGGRPGRGGGCLPGAGVAGGEGDDREEGDQQRAAERHGQGEVTQALPLSDTLPGPGGGCPQGPPRG